MQIGQRGEEREHPIEEEKRGKDEEENLLHILYLYMPSDHKLQGLLFETFTNFL